jgi:TolB-like protein/Flp pilus assembly protein TadD
MSAKPSFFAELKRRNVLRAGALYAAAAWALAQGGAQLLPVFNAPDWVTRWLVIATAIGFPFWLAFAWFFEFTPTGLKRESEIDPADSISAHTGRKLDFWIIGVLLVAVVLLATNTFVLRRDATSTANGVDAMALAVGLAKVPNQSVAVLPLVNESGDPKQQYFSDGLSEELISDLIQINGLKVIGKYSSFKFRNSKESPAQIGAALGVAHLIQGSLRQQGDRIRVTVDLIRTRDGAGIWSHSYDEPLKDVFAIQTKIGQAVASALKIQLLGPAHGIDDKPPSGNIEAYQLMLQGRALTRHLTDAGLHHGIALYQQALESDPDYAYVWGLLSNAWVNLGYNGYVTGAAQQQAYAQARVAADKQQALAPDAAATHMTRGYLLSQVDSDSAGALVAFKRAYALAPHDGTVMSFLAGGLENVGQLQPAVELMRKAIATDPLRPDLYAGLAQPLVAQGKLDTAEQAIRKALILQPDFPGMYMTLAEIDILRGDAAAAVRDAKLEDDPTYGPWIRTMAPQIGPDQPQAAAALRDYIAKNGKTQPYFVADLYALRKQPDKMFDWLQRALTRHDPNLVGSLLTDPIVLAWQHDPRFATLCKQTGLPLPGEMLPASAATLPNDSSPVSADAATSKP